MSDQSKMASNRSGCVITYNSACIHDCNEIPMDILLFLASKIITEISRFIDRLGHIYLGIAILVSIGLYVSTWNTRYRRPMGIMEFKPASNDAAKPVTRARERLLFCSQCAFKHEGTQYPRLIITLIISLLGQILSFRIIISGSLYTNAIFIYFIYIIFT